MKCGEPCELNGPYVKPILRDNSKLLLLVDFPSPRDEERGILFSSLERRAQKVFEAIQMARVDDGEVSIASAVRCTTKSKDMRLSSIRGCAEKLLRNVPDTKILCFGVATFCAITGKPIDSIDKYRKEYVYVTIGGRERLVGCTYSLSLIAETGCGACNHATYTVLMSKDIKRIIKEQYDGSSKEH